MQFNRREIDQIQKSEKYQSIQESILPFYIQLYEQGQMNYKTALEAAANKIIEAELYTQELADLIDLVERVVHPNYLLAATLKSAVGFHYGNIPLVVREGVERLFTNGQ